MVDSYVAPLVITCIWVFVGIICPFFARGPSKGVTQCCLMLTAATCWLLVKVTTCHGFCQEPQQIFATFVQGSSESLLYIQ
uniref:V-type proton ATPase subunit n=1 Tax=Glossina austeni TaxID=7395 RepID=A0A1A9UP84_GLOAU